MKTAPFTTPGRTVIPCYCWIRKPGTWDRCTEDPGHNGAHHDWASGQCWPNRGPEPQ
ncbi:hypothetical protein [Streptomyces wuyuanensis]|uniref:hypothetical protein n=1 Tax=Streptomyces wuyuanensis TaxID=1196353 RepID=UPI0037A025FA